MLPPATYLLWQLHQLAADSTQTHTSEQNIILKAQPIHTVS